MSRLMFVGGVLRVLGAAAPELDWSGQKKILAALKRDAGRGDPARKQGRILSSAVLFQAGLGYATKTADAASTQLQTKKSLRDGSMVAFLALLPMRRRAFATLELGASVQVTLTAMQITLCGDMIKTGQPWEAPVPELLLV